MTDDVTQPVKPVDDETVTRDPGESPDAGSGTREGTDEVQSDGTDASELTEVDNTDVADLTTDAAATSDSVDAPEPEAQIDVEVPSDASESNPVSDSLAEPPVLQSVAPEQPVEPQPEPEVAIAPPPAAVPNGEGFTWHPTYKGRTYDDVRSSLTEDIARDQRTYELAMAGAEGAEHDALKSVVDLERRWSQYDFDWVEADSAELAARIMAFEKDREQRQELRSFAEFRSTGALQQPEPTAPAAPARSLPIVPIGVAVLAVLILVFILFAVR